MTEGIDIQDSDYCWNDVGVHGDSSCPELNHHTHCRNCSTYASAALRLLNAPSPDDYRKEWTEHLARQAEETPAGTEPVLVFKLGDHWNALAADFVEEVREMAMIHAVPHRNEEVLRGVVNVRGELLIAVSLGRWFGYHRAIRPEQNSLVGNEERLVVAGHGDHRFVFPVSQVRGIRHLEPDKLSPADQEDYPVARDFSRGEAVIDGHRVHVLDHQPLFRAISQSLK